MPEMNLGRVGLSVLPLGVGDAFSVLHHPTSMLVSRYQTPAWDNDLILIDCPQSIRRMMREADDGRFHGLDLHRVNTLVLTHLHADHASGLETIAAFFKIAVGRKPRLVALPEVLEGVPRFLESLESLGTMDELFDVVELPTDRDLALDVGGTPVTLVGRRTAHPIPTSALTFSMRSGDATQTFAYSCDTTFDRDLWEWLWRAWRASREETGLVIHEVGHGIHTSYDDILHALGFRSGRDMPSDAWRRATMKAQLRAKSLRLTHYPDDMLPLLESSGLPLLREGKLEVL